MRISLIVSLVFLLIQSISFADETKLNDLNQCVQKIQPMYNTINSALNNNNNNNSESQAINYCSTRDAQCILSQTSERQTLAEISNECPIINGDEQFIRE